MRSEKKNAEIKADIDINLSKNMYFIYTEEKYQFFLTYRQHNTKRYMSCFV